MDGEGRHRGQQRILRRGEPAGAQPRKVGQERRVGHALREGLGRHRAVQHQPLAGRLRQHHIHPHRKGLRPAGYEQGSADADARHQPRPGHEAGQGAAQGEPGIIGNSRQAEAEGAIKRGCHQTRERLAEFEQGHERQDRNRARPGQEFQQRVHHRCPKPANDARLSFTAGRHCVRLRRQERDDRPNRQQCRDPEQADMPADMPSEADDSVGDDEHGDPVAPHVGREGAALLALGKQLDPPGIDRDVLARGAERHQRGRRDRPSRRRCRVGHRQ